MTQHTTPRPEHTPAPERGTPSPWVCRFAAVLTPGARVLDLACGSGRHAHWLAGRGYAVHAVDRDAAALATLDGVPGVRTQALDLEGARWPLEGESFDAVVVTNYLYRAHFEALLALVRPGGVLIYETFMLGNARFGKPSNPDFLLQPGELLERVREGWSVLAFEQGEVSQPRPAVVQRVCAVRGTSLPPLP